jgi:subtilisin family serine protease
LHSDNVESLSKKIQGLSASVQESIEWIGHMRPQYKTDLKITESNAVLSKSGTVDLVVTLVERNNQIASSVVSRLNSVFSSNRDSVKVFKTSDSTLSVRVKPEYVEDVIDIISKQEEVVWIERKKSAQLFNYAMNQIIQSDGTDEVLTGFASIWNKGITGEGETIAVSDTGIDFDMCFFHDDKTPVPVQQIDRTHRKIIGYELFSMDSDGEKVTADEGDEPSGHGTHVAGTIAGSIPTEHQNSETLGKFNGVAKDAKIYFTDIGQSSGDLIAPDNLGDLFINAYEKGEARIFSNSWGCGVSGFFDCYYDCDCYWKNGTQADDRICMENFGGKCCQVCAEYDVWAHSADTFAYEHDDMLLLFAAGNDGTISSFGSVTTPCIAKNNLCVGASVTLNQHLISSVEYENFDPIFASAQRDGHNITTTEQCCSANSDDYDETYADWLHRTCCPEYMRQMYQTKPEYFNQKNMASFSARGPAIDGRVKPDVVATGQRVISTHSDGDLTTHNCGIQHPDEYNSAALLAMKGTSQATPGVSGAAGLVRQYLRTKKSIENPSSMLLKASIVHSGNTLTGTVDLDGQQTDNVIDLPRIVPNMYYGFGGVSLMNVLEFEDSKFKLHLDDRVELKKNQKRRYCFTIFDDNDGEIDATITWLDPPAALSSRNTLVNNLDLDIFIRDSTGTVVRRIRGNGGESNDDINNTEKASVITINSSNVVTVEVTAKRVVTQSQMYAIVITTSKNMEKISEGQCNSASKKHISYGCLLLVVLAYLICM